MRETRERDEAVRCGPSGESAQLAEGNAEDKTTLKERDNNAEIRMLP